MKNYKSFINENNIEKLTLKEVLTKIIKKELKPDTIFEYFGDKINKYKIINNDSDYIKFDVRYEEIDDILDVPEGTTNLIQYLDFYDYEYYVDDSEVDYISYNLTDKQKKNLIEFAKYIGYKNTNYNDANFFPELIEEYNLSEIKDDYIGELMDIKKNAVQRKKHEEIDKLVPFEIDNDGLDLNYEETIKYINQFDLKEITTLEELFESIPNKIDYNNEIEYDISDYENYEDMIETINSAINMIWDSEHKLLEPNYIITLIYNIRDNKENINIIKKIFDKISWEYKEKFYMEGYKYYFQMYYSEDSDTYKWIVSDDFNKRLEKYINDNDIDSDDEMIKTYKQMRIKTKAKQFKI